MPLVQKEVKKVYMWKEPYTDYSAMQGPCSTGYHIPTGDELDNLVSILTSLGTTSLSDLQQYLKASLSGRRAYDTGNVNSQGTAGYWLASTLTNNNADKILIYSGGVLVDKGGDFNSWGFSIRPFKDVAITPDTNRTVLYQGTGDAGIYHNSTLGLISLSSNGTTWLTIADKNLGATSTDISSTDSYGYYYQRGNNYGFPTTGTVTKSSSQVNASTYGPGNYYSSSTFITRTSSPYGWDSSNNANLRGGVTGTVSGGGDILIRPIIKDIYADFILVGGGGGGGGSTGYTHGGGGGGAGGYIECNNYFLCSGTYNVTIGAGGAGTASCYGNNGGNSTFNSIVAYGGGGGGGCYGYVGCDGGSGGGGGVYARGGCGCSGQGNSGGCGSTSYSGGGGGGAGGSGSNSSGSIGGTGGAGKCSCISGSCQWYSGGGGGGSYCRCTHGTGSNGGGSASNASSYGSGGGGGQYYYSSFGWNGCQGVFILRYPTACGYSISGGTCYTCGDYTIHCFTANGTLTVN